MNPCTDAWEARFETVGDELRPRENDIHAAYTHRLYRLADLRKVAMRRHRRETLIESRTLRDEYLPLWDQLMRKALDDGDVEAGATAKALFRGVQLAQKNLELFRAIPHDADSVDRQGNAIEPLALPEVLEEQTWSL